MSFADFCVDMPVREVTLEEIGETLNNSEWSQMLQQEFAQKAQPADAIYYYCSPPEQWDVSMGSEGYVLVRDGQIIHSVVLRMN